MTRRFAAIVLWGCMLAGHASADRVHLTSGSVIEGRAHRDGDRVVVEIDSGEVALPASVVARIESSESDLQRVDAMLAKLKPGDTAGMLKLADYCRDHEMPAREQELLQRILDTAPNHAEARARLGYVRSEGAWVKREDQMRAQGMVEYQGRWMTRAEMLELERIQAQTAAAALQRDKAAAEARKAEAEAKKAEEQASAAQQNAPPAYGYPPPYSTYSYGTPYTYNYAVPYSYSYAPIATHGGARCARVGGGTGPCGSAAPPPAPAHHPFPIPGMKDPFDYLR
jgi:hypothetical protein